MQQITGFKRNNGTYGIRNYVAFVTGVDSINPVARQAASLVRGSIALAPAFGRGETGEDRKLQTRTRIGLATNPNIYGVVVISLEPRSAGIIADAVAENGQPVEVISIMDSGGTVNATAKAVSAASRMVAEAGKLEREEIPWPEFVLGVECGGSGGSSIIVSNPATGLVSDMVVDRGGSVLLSETLELIGGERILAENAESPEVAAAFMEVINSTISMLKARGIKHYNMVPDNIAGGLSTPEEKSLGAIKKAGSSPLREVIMNAEKPTKKGLVFMDAHAPGVENMTSIAAGGAQAIIFTTCKGNTIGNPVSPTIKVTANPDTVKFLGDNIDVDLSGVLKSTLTLEEGARLLEGELIAVCNGKQTKSEILGQVEISITRIID